MMSSVKIQNFINTATGGGLTGVQADALLSQDADIANGFSQALSWEGTQQRMVSSPEFYDLIATTSDLLNSLLSERALWKTLLTNSEGVKALAGNHSAVSVIQSNAWAWDAALDFEGFTGPLLGDSESLSNVGVHSLTTDAKLWSLVQGSEYALNWLYADDLARTKSIFDNNDSWVATASAPESLKAYFQNGDAITYALEEDPAKIASADSGTMITALTDNQVTADILHKSPNRFEAIPNTLPTVRRVLQKQPVDPTLITLVTAYGTLTTTDSQANIQWQKPEMKVNGVTTLPDNSGYVLTASADATDVGDVFTIEHYDWSHGVGPKKTFTFTDRSNAFTLDTLSVSPNGQYAAYADTYQAIVVDLVAGTVVTDVPLLGAITVNPKAFAVSNAGEIYIGEGSGRVVAITMGGSSLRWDKTLGITNKNIACLTIESSGDILVFYYQSNEIRRIDTEGVVLDNFLAGTTLYMTHNSAYYDETRSGYYLVSQGGSYISYLSSTDTWTTITTTSGHRCGSGTSFVDSSGVLHSTYTSTYVTADYTTVTALAAADKWMYTTDAEYAGFVGHPTHPLAVVDDLGGCPLNSSIEPITEEWMPHDILVAGLNIKAEAHPGELVVYQGNYILVFDHLSGDLLRGWRPPFVDKMNSATNAQLIPQLSVTAIYRTVLTPKGERLYAGSTSSSISRFYEADGTLRWAVFLGGTNSTVTDVMIHPEGYIVVVSGYTTVTTSDVSDATVISSVTLATSNADTVHSTFKDVIVISPRLATGRFYTLKTTVTNLSVNNYLGGTSGIYTPNSSYNRIVSAGWLDDCFYSKIISTHASSYSDYVKFTQFNMETGAELATFELTEAWATDNGLSGYLPDVLVYDGVEDVIYGVSSYSIIRIENWREGAGGAYVAKNHAFPYSVPSSTSNRGICSNTGLASNNAW